MGRCNLLSVEPVFSLLVFLVTSERPFLIRWKTPVLGVRQAFVIVFANNGLFVFVFVFVLFLAIFWDYSRTNPVRERRFVF